MGTHYGQNQHHCTLVKSHSFQYRTYIEWEWSTWLALHRCDGGNHGATGHDCTVHLHPLIGGWGRRLPRPHLTGLQVGKLKNPIQVTTLCVNENKRCTEGIHLNLLILKANMWKESSFNWDEGLTSVVSDPVTTSLVLSANVCCPFGCFFTRSTGTTTWPSKESEGEKPPNSVCYYRNRCSSRTSNCSL